MAKAPASNLPAVQEQNTDLSLMEAPAFFQDKGTVRGTELIESSDMTMPRLALCQSGNPQRKKANVKYIEGLEEGEFFNSLTKIIYRPQPVKIVPLFFYKSRILFKDLEDGGGILCQAFDGHSCALNNGGPCLHAEWGKDGTAPECTELFNFACITAVTRELVILSLKSTGIKAAKDLNSMIRMRRRDAFAGVYDLTSFPDKKKDQDFYAIKIDNAGWNTPDKYPGLFEFCEKMYEAIAPKVKSGEMQMHTDEALGQEVAEERTSSSREPGQDDEL